MFRAIICSPECLHANLKREPEVGVRPNDRLDACTPSMGKTHNRVTIRTSEWEDPNEGVGLTVASEWRFCPISGVVNLVRI